MILSNLRFKNENKIQNLQRLKFFEPRPDGTGILRRGFFIPTLKRVGYDDALPPEGFT
jgi:hypothetical protein